MGITVMRFATVTALVSMLLQWISRPATRPKSRILQNQLGRRNLTDFSNELALLPKPLIEAKARANQSAMGGPLRQKSDEVEPIRTDETIAAIAGCVA